MVVCRLGVPFAHQQKGHPQYRFFVCVFPLFVGLCCLENSRLLGYFVKTSCHDCCRCPPLLFGHGSKLSHQESDRRCSSSFPGGRASHFGVPIFDPHPFLIVRCSPPQALSALESTRPNILQGRGRRGFPFSKMVAPASWVFGAKGRQQLSAPPYFEIPRPNKYQKMSLPRFES